MKSKGGHLKKSQIWTIGWKEVVDLPALNLKGIRAKTDTGALTSVLHCSKIQLKEINGEKFVEFIPIKPAKHPDAQVFVFPYIGEKTIKNSFGKEEIRYYIKTTIKLFNQELPIELTLRDRSGMEFPMLLGRSFIKGKFLVDVGQSNLSQKTIIHFNK